ncbi:unnamed protein product [Ranitomeya imitator]|uniref:Reverse transcriptase domain-containing protein n=1 Tax=Ranitomeya imitator TaxID=111125 RepID=A0ABN9LG90_9NEOB|nr:unnamed protein product [Ranitomeya imitator]
MTPANQPEDSQHPARSQPAYSQRPASIQPEASQRPARGQPASSQRPASIQPEACQPVTRPNRCQPGPCRPKFGLNHRYFVVILHSVVPHSDDEEGGLDVDRLIEEVRERESLWDMADRSHADQLVTRRLWEQICFIVVDNWEDLEPRQQTRARERVMKQWRSLRDRFKREFNKEMQVPSGSRGRRSQYKYGRALLFLRSTMLSRSLRLKVHFEDNPHSTSNTLGTVPDRDRGPLITLDQLGLRNPSKFMPPKTNHAVETFITLLDRDIKETILDQRLGFLPVRHNLTPLENQALTSLKDNSHIVIKPADKGGATVVMNKNQYVAEIKRQLADTTTYRKIQSDPVYNIRRKIDTILTKHSQLQTIDAKTKTFLTNDHPVTPVLYILPKIHKNLLNPPGHPIVASTDSILNPVSVYLEKLLTPYTHKTKSFILDTSDFLKKIQYINTIPANSILCTLDVNSLYTSITHDTGIEAVSLTLSEAGVDTRSQDLCLELLNLVLRENYLLFEDDFYVQICGTAMGSNVAPAYANLYMDHFERDFVYPDTLFQQHALLWYCYIDDIFCIWQGDHTSLTTFHNTINEIRPELKFSISHHMEAITFLDTKVCKDVHGSLTTDIYTKPTDCNNLLLYNSCHPKSTRNSLPRSQFKRVSRIVSIPTVRQTRLHEMSKKFEDRAYPCTLLNTEMTKVLSETDPTSTPLPKPPRLPFVHGHHPSMQRVHNLIHKQWPLLTKAYPGITIFKNPPLMCLRRPPNLKDRLVRAEVGSPKQTVTRTLSGLTRRGTFPCLNCTCCSNIIKGSEVVHPRTGKSYPNRDYHTCESNYVVSKPGIQA